MRSKNHAGNPYKSDRLRRTLDCLLLRPMTTWELRQYTDSCAPASDVEDLRKNGYQIQCERQPNSKNGRKIYLYTYRGRNA